MPKSFSAEYIVIGDHQYFEGYTLFLCKWHVSEIHFLEQSMKQQFLLEMSIVAEAVYNAFSPDKLNYELLGNGDSHMHWHLFPRRLTEENPKYPVWWTDRNIMYSDAVRPSREKQIYLKQKLLEELKKLIKPMSESGFNEEEGIA